MTFVTLQRCFKAIDANLLASRLNAAGFHAEVVGEIASLVSDAGPMTNGGISVRVPEAEAAEANEFLNAGDIDENGIPD